jgi:hypothetical protein
VKRTTEGRKGRNEKNEWKKGVNEKKRWSMGGGEGRERERERRGEEEEEERERERGVSGRQRENQEMGCPNGVRRRWRVWHRRFLASPWGVLGLEARRKVFNRLRVMVVMGS